jgi:hypothetical protein
MEDLHTVDIREPEVENNHGGRVDGLVVKTGVTGRGGTDLMAKGTQSDAACRQQCGVVVDDEDGRHFSAPRAGL